MTLDDIIPNFHIDLTSMVNSNFSEVMLKIAIPLAKRTYHQELTEKRKYFSSKAFKSVRLKSYARVDLRMKEEIGQIFVLDINDICDVGLVSSGEMMLNQIGKTTAKTFLLYINYIFFLGFYILLLNLKL